MHVAAHQPLDAPGGDVLLDIRGERRGQDVQNDDEERITVIGAVDYASHKLPLIGLGKGKTPRYLTKITKDSIAVSGPISLNLDGRRHRFRGSFW
jgi:hypothetical protein